VRCGSPLRHRVRRCRVLGWDRNPVRRRIDRLEGSLLVGLIAVFLIAAPVLAEVADHGIRAAGLRQERAEASRRQVWAVVQDGVTPGDVPQGRFPWPAKPVSKPVQWTTPGGRARTGWVLVSAEAAAGSRSRVWVTRQGSLTGPPLRPAQLRERISIAGALTACGVGVLLIFVGLAGRYLLHQRRLASWDKAWRAVEPHLTKRAS
jgi:hypothetical protein